MARSSQGIALVAAAAVIGGLAWWFLAPAGAPAPVEEGGSRPAATPEGTVPAPKAASTKAVVARPVGTLLAVVKGEGKPVAATLTAVPAADIHAEAATAEGSAADGGVRLAAAPAGVKLRVSVAAAGWRTAVLADVEVPAGGEKDLGTIDLERALPATGRVLDPAGKPVAGATVGALADDAAARFDFRKLGDLVLNEPDWKAKSTTREDGTFTLDALGPGTWNLVATAAGFSPSAEKNVLLHPAGTAPPVDLVLQQGHSLLVKVTGPGNAPVPGAEAAAASSGNRGGLPASMGPARGVTDAGGEARLSGIAPGRTVVAVRASEGRLVVRTVEVPTATTVTVRMEGTASLVVRVKNAEGAPVEGAAVLAMTQAGNSGMDSGEALNGKTGADGSVKWERLPPARLMFVMVEKDGFPPVTPDGGGMMQGREELKEGQTIEKEVVLKAGAVVTGTVRRRPGEAAVPGAKVTATGGASFFGGQPIRATADAEGAYRLEGVAEGRVSLAASAPGLAPPETWTTGSNPFMNMNPQEGQPLPEGVLVVAPGGGEQKKDLWLEETGTVSGRVLGPTGEGVGGARVEVSANGGFNFRGFGFGGGANEVLPGPVLTAADGSFTVKGVPAGQGLAARGDAPNFIAASSTPFNLAAGESATAVEIRLTEGGFLAGRVTSGSGTPVAGAKVRASARQSRPGGRMVGPMQMQGQLEATSSADGTWRIATVPPGPVTVTVEAEGFIDATKGDLTVASGVETRADVSLEPGRVIAGTVKDAAGAAVEGARVVARSSNGTPPEAMKYKQGVTDAAGAFRLTGLPTGAFVLTVNAQGNAMRTIPDVAAGNESLDIRLAPSVRLSGKVVDSDGNPVQGAMVRADAEGPDGTSGGGRSGQDGAYEVDGLVAGTYRVTAQTFDRKYARAELKGVAGDATGVVLTLAKALEIRGKVVGADGGIPPERGSLWATEASGTPTSFGPTMRTRWEEDGTFVLAGLSEGSYTLHAVIQGKFEGTATAQAGSTAVSIRLEANAAAGTGGTPGDPPRPHAPGAALKALRPAPC